MSTYIVRVGRGSDSSKTLYLTNDLEIAKLKMKEFSKKHSLIHNQGKLHAIVKTDSIDDFKNKTSLITEGYIQLLAMTEMLIQVYYKKTNPGILRNTTEYFNFEEFYIEEFNPDSIPFKNCEYLDSDFIEISESLEQETKSEIKVEKTEIPKKEKTKEENYNSVIQELKTKFNETSKLKKKLN